MELIRCNTETKSLQFKLDEKLLPRMSWSINLSKLNMIRSVCFSGDDETWYDLLSRDKDWILCRQKILTFNNSQQQQKYNDEKPLDSLKLSSSSSMFQHGRLNDKWGRQKNVAPNICRYNNLASRETRNKPTVSAYFLFLTIYFGIVGIQIEIYIEC